MLVFGSVWQYFRDPGLRPNSFKLNEQTGQLLVEVERNYGTPKRSSKHLVSFIAARDSIGTAATHGKALVTLGLDSLHSPPQPGDLLLLRTYLKPVDRIPDPGGFDRRSWADHIGAMGEAYVNEDRWALLNSTESSVGLYWKYEKLLRNAESILDSTLGVTGAIYFCSRAGYDNILTFDMGSTSTDVALIQNSKLFFDTRNVVKKHPELRDRVELL